MDIEVAYADAGQWSYWAKENRPELPRPPREPTERKRASDGSEYALSTRLLDLDPLEQRVTYEIRAKRWRDGELETEETHSLTIGLYFKNELVDMLKAAGFADVAVEGDHNDAAPTNDDEFLVFVAKK